MHVEVFIGLWAPWSVTSLSPSCFCICYSSNACDLFYRLVQFCCCDRISDLWAVSWQINQRSFPFCVLLVKIRWDGHQSLSLMWQSTVVTSVSAWLHSLMLLIRRCFECVSWEYSRVLHILLTALKLQCTEALSSKIRVHSFSNISLLNKCIKNKGIQCKSMYKILSNSPASQTKCLHSYTSKTD